jgi:ActR/RegA family two-component response regulator
MNILLGDDDRCFAKSLSLQCGERNFGLLVADAADTLFDLLDRGGVDHLVLEPNLPGRLWFSLLHGVRDVSATMPVTIATAFPSRALSLVTASLGMGQTFTKPLNYDELFSRIEGKPGGCPHVGFREPSLALLEWEYINHALRRYKGNVAEASRRLGLPRQTLYRKLRKYPPLR